METIISTVAPEDICMEFDYKGFMTDFKIADAFGVKAIRDTYRRAFNGWKDNVDYFASLVMTLNHQIWNWYKINPKIAKVYNELWEKADVYGRSHFKGEDATYYFRFLDQPNMIDTCWRKCYTYASFF